jgi:hypothetical protein
LQRFPSKKSKKKQGATERKTAPEADKNCYSDAGNGSVIFSTFRDNSKLKTPTTLGIAEVVK